MVDGSGPRALGGAGLRLGAARGEGGGVPQGRRAAAGLHRGQTVHDAGETLQTGGAGGLIGQNLYRNGVGTSLNQFVMTNPANWTFRRWRYSPFFAYK